MNKVIITHGKLKKFEKYIDERKEIVEMNISPADKVYYEGMLKAIELLGFDYTIKDGKHKLF